MLLQQQHNRLVVLKSCFIQQKTVSTEKPVMLKGMEFYRVTALC